MREPLEQLREGPREKIAAGQERLWAWYQDMKLRETLDAILAGRDVVTTESSPQSEQHQETRRQLVGSTDPQYDVPHRPGCLPTRMPR